MSDTNLPPNIESAINDLNVQYGNLAASLGGQISLINEFNSKLNNTLDLTAGAQGAMGALKNPIEELTKSIQARMSGGGGRP